MYPTPEQLADWAIQNPNVDLKNRIVNLKRYARTCPDDVAQRVLAIVRAYERKLEEVV